MDGTAIDYDLHGLAGVRVVGATARDAAAVDRQLGPIRGPLRRDPDIVVRFVDHLDVEGPLRLLGVDDAGFTDDAFLVLRARHKARARVLIPLDRIGRRCEIVCERGLPAVPLLIATLNLTVLARGALPLHASAFFHDGCGVVVTGWSKVRTSFRTATELPRGEGRPWCAGAGRAAISVESLTWTGAGLGRIPRPRDAQ